MGHECSSYRWGEGPSKNNIIQSLLSNQNFIKNLKIRLQYEFMKYEECLIFHFRWITGPGEANKSCWRNTLNKVKFIMLLWCVHHWSPNTVSAKVPMIVCLLCSNDCFCNHYCTESGNSIGATAQYIWNLIKNIQHTKTAQMLEPGVSFLLTSLGLALLETCFFIDFFYMWVFSLPGKRSKQPPVLNYF